MSYIGALRDAQYYAQSASSTLSRYDYSKGPSDRENMRVVYQALDQISPQATGSGTRALDEARYDRRVPPSAIRDVGHGLEYLDRAWWNLQPSAGPNIQGARDALWGATDMFNRAQRYGWY